MQATEADVRLADAEVRAAEAYLRLEHARKEVIQHKLRMNRRGLPVNLGVGSLS